MSGGVFGGVPALGVGLRGFELLEGRLLAEANGLGHAFVGEFFGQKPLPVGDAFGQHQRARCELSGDGAVKGGIADMHHADEMHRRIALGEHAFLHIDAGQVEAQIIVRLLFQRADQRDDAEPGKDEGRKYDGGGEGAISVWRTRCCFTGQTRRCQIPGPGAPAERDDDGGEDPRAAPAAIEVHPSPAPRRRPEQRKSAEIDPDQEQRRGQEKAPRQLRHENQQEHDDERGEENAVGKRLARIFQAGIAGDRIEERVRRR